MAKNKQANHIKKKRKEKENLNFLQQGNFNIGLFFQVIETDHIFVVLYVLETFCAQNYVLCFFK